MSATPTPTIVLIHGFGANRYVMLPMVWRFRALGFRVINVGYFSLLSIRRTSQQLVEQLRRLDQDPSVGPLHLVAHSMGSILVRNALKQYRPANLGRVVMMTPPSKGSPRADTLAPWLGWLIRPLDELQTRPDSFVNRLPPPDFPFAVMRASHDFLVPNPFEQLEGADDRTLIRGMHSYVLLSRDAIQQIVCYLESGHFQPPAEEVTAVSN